MLTMIVKNHHIYQIQSKLIVAMIRKELSFIELNLKTNLVPELQVAMVKRKISRMEMDNL